MDELLYNACLRYFTSIANVGSRNDEDVKKLLFYVYIQELVNTTSIVISEEDYRHIEGALYSIYGTTCLIPYPNYCEESMFAHLGNTAELSARMAKVEEKNAIQDVELADYEVRLEAVEEAAAPTQELINRVATIENTRVTKNEEDIEDVDDVIIPSDENNNDV